MPQFVGHHHALQPGTAHGFAGVALAQEQDVRLHIRRRDAGEGTHRQADRAQQFGLRRDVLAHGIRARLHRAGARDETHQAAGADQVQRAAEEVVVDPKARVRLGAGVGDRVVAEGYVADHQVEPVFGQRELLEGHDAHVGTVRCVQRLQQTPRQPVDLHRGERAAFGECPRHGTEEMADARCGFQHTAAGEAEARHGLPYRLDHVDLGVVAVVDRGAGRVVVLGRQQGLQLLGATAPRRIVAFEVEGGGQAAPAGEAQQLTALFGVRGTLTGFEHLQDADGRDVGVELRDGAAQAGQLLTVQCWPQDSGFIALGAGDNTPAGARRGGGRWTFVGCLCAGNDDPDRHVRSLHGGGGGRFRRGGISKQIRLGGRIEKLWLVRVEARQPQGRRGGACHRWFSEGKRGTHRPMGEASSPYGMNESTRPCARRCGHRAQGVRWTGSSGLPWRWGG